MGILKSSQRSIGVFDSGIGGVTVLCALAKLFPLENFVYLGDTARLPYGTKSAETIQRYTAQNLKFLNSKNVKALVIACNTASAQWMQLRATEMSHQQVPVFDVISPGARAAEKISNNKRIGVLGTRATIKSGAYERTLKQLNPSCEVFSLAAPLLVPLAEEGWVDDPITNLIVFRYLQPLLQQQIDTLVLGCTHYPILRNAIQKAAGINMNLVDSGIALGEDLTLAMNSGQVVAASKSEPSQQKIDFYCTDTSDSFKSLAKSLLHQQGLEFQNFEVADLSEIG